MIDWWVYPEVLNAISKGGQQKALTVAARLLGLVSNEVARLYTHILHVESHFRRTIIWAIVLVGFLQISYHVIYITFAVMNHLQVSIW